MSGELMAERTGAEMPRMVRKMMIEMGRREME